MENKKLARYEKLLFVIFVHVSFKVTTKNKLSFTMFTANFGLFILVMCVFNVSYKVVPMNKCSLTLLTRKLDYFVLLMS